MRNNTNIIYRLGILIFFLFLGINLNAQNPKIFSVKRESKDYLVTKLLLNNDNLSSNFIRLNDEIEFLIQPQTTNNYTNNINILAKRGKVSIKIINENNSLVEFIEVSELKPLNENFTQKLNANHNYKLLIKGEDFKGKINLKWLK